MAILCHRAAGYGIAFLLQQLGQFVIGQRLFLVLVVNALFEYLAYFAYRHLFAVFGCVAVVEEELQRVDAVVGLYIFAVADAGLSHSKTATTKAIFLLL